ncbi:hypothetical protein ACFVTY_06370 [Streptomyces sp. NPDC058067]|uniref:hypothetical protein n=1 Tax=Streptomyces sp. NPDC058067 TaxID=3346324 RepID=UPI0036EDA939
MPEPLPEPLRVTDGRTASAYDEGELATTHLIKLDAEVTPDRAGQTGLAGGRLFAVGRLGVRPWPRGPRRPASLIPDTTTYKAGD